MLRFFHTADIHLGASNQPVQYREQALPLLFRDARSLGVRVILIVGDVFDRDQPNQRIKDYLLSQVVNAPDIQFVITIGNHDYTTKAKDYHSLKTYAILEGKVPNVRICEAGVHDLGSFTLVVLPDTWGDLPSGDFPIKADCPVICAWHGSLLDKDYKTEINNLLKKTGAHYLALGDIHKHVQLHTRCWYPGALTQKTYACEEGYVFVEVEGRAIETSLRHLPLPKRFNLSVEFDSRIDTAEDVIEVVQKQIPKGSLVRLKFKLPLSVWAVLNKRKIHDELLKDYFEVKLHNDPVLEEIVRQGAKKLEGAKDINEEIKAVLDSEETNLDRVKLMAILKAYVTRK